MFYELDLVVHEKFRAKTKPRSSSLKRLFDKVLEHPFRNGVGYRKPGHVHSNQFLIFYQHASTTLLWLSGRCQSNITPEEQSKTVKRNVNDVLPQTRKSPKLWKPRVAKLNTITVKAQFHASVSS